jgi:hypothetical protein
MFDVGHACEILVDIAQQPGPSSFSFNVVRAHGSHPGIYEKEFKFSPR